MPIYHQEPENDSPEVVQRRPYQSFGCFLLHFGPIVLYCSKYVLEDDIRKLVAEAFDIRRLDAAKWGVGVDPHADLQGALGLPAYYGKNLNALRDCMQDLIITDDGGMAVILADFDDFARRERDFARGILDAFAYGSRFLQVFGKTLLVMVHTKNPDVDFGELGAVTAWWNEKEFVRADRANLKTS